MTAYNLAFGGDVHYNPNYAMYPQNALIEGRPEFGSSETVLKPAYHWAGGLFSEVRHFNFNDRCHQCALADMADKFVDGDSFLSHVVPGQSLLTDFVWQVHTPVEGLSLDVVLASTGDVLGTIDASVAGCGWVEISPTYVPCDTNDGIEIVLNGWPDTVADGETDPCGVFGPCTTPVPLCFTATTMYKNPRAEKWCEDTCYDNCAC